MAERTCDVNGCEERHRGRGLCNKHLLRWRKYGSTADRSLSVEERFWMKVDKSGDCWTWTASVFTDRYGYGKFQAGSSRANARAVYAHRFSWELHHGPIPDGMFVCHHCDNPPCVRPDHLFLGTQADNAADMARKGRGRAALTAAEAREVKALLATGIGPNETARRLGIPKHTAQAISAGRLYRQA